MSNPLKLFATLEITSNARHNLIMRGERQRTFCGMTASLDGTGKERLTAETGDGIICRVTIEPEAPRDQWRPIAMLTREAVAGEMFQWGYWEGAKFQTGLAYWTKGGSWRDTSGPVNTWPPATHFRRLGEPPPRLLREAK